MSSIRNSVENGTTVGVYPNQLPEAQEYLTREASEAIDKQASCIKVEES